MNLAIIPARGGSKRIPRKNIKDFCGKPIIAYSIETAIKSGLFDKVIVSTDDEEIAEVARNYGAETPFMRPEELADDYTGTTAVAKHAIEWYLEQGIEFENICLIYATAPFLCQKNLQLGLNSLLNESRDFCFSAAQYNFPVQRSLVITSAGNVTPLIESAIEHRSQDLELVIHDAGQFYWGRSHAFLNFGQIFACNSKPILIPSYLVQDIDTDDDWYRAQLLYKLKEEINNVK